MYSNVTRSILAKITALGMELNDADENQSYINESMEELASAIVIGDIKRKATSFEEEVKAIAEAFGKHSVSAAFEFQDRVHEWVRKTRGSVTPPSDVAQKARALNNLLGGKQEWTPALKAGFIQTLLELQEIGEEL